MNQDEAFWKRLTNHPPTTTAGWLAYVREAAYKHGSSPLRNEIALELAGHALVHVTMTEEEKAQLQPIKDALYELEIPDSHLAPGYMDDYTLEEAVAYTAFAQSYVSYLWRKLADMLPNSFTKKI